MRNDIILSKKRILLARTHFLNKNLNPENMLLILQVFSGVKPAASLDQVKEKNESRVMATLEEMGLDYKIIKKRHK